MASITANENAPAEFTIRVPSSREPLASAAIQEAISRHASQPDSERVYLRWLLTHPQAPEETLLRLCEQGLYLDDLGHRQGPRLSAENARTSLPLSGGRTDPGKADLQRCGGTGFRAA